MYWCGTRKSHPRTRRICQKWGSVEFLTKLFRSEGGISLSHTNTFSRPLYDFLKLFGVCQFRIKNQIFPFAQGFNSDTVWVDSLWKLSQILYESVTDSLPEGHGFFTVLVYPLEEEWKWLLWAYLEPRFVEKCILSLFLFLHAFWFSSSKPISKK